MVQQVVTLKEDIQDEFRRFAFSLVLLRPIICCNTETRTWCRQAVVVIPTQGA
jgi:hypothetical protein